MTATEIREALKGKQTQDKMNVVAGAARAYADLLENGEIRYRPNGDKLLVIELEKGRPPEPSLPEPLDYTDPDLVVRREGESP